MSNKLTTNAKEIIEEINKLRSDPSIYAKKVEEYSHYFTGKIIKLPNLNIKIQTQEGAAPYLETIEYLKTKEKTNELIPSKALFEIAEEIAENVKDSETGEIDENLYEKIIDDHGTFNGKFTRAMDFGGFTSEQIVINFLVCDGDIDRTQREPLLGTGLKKIGIAFTEQNVYKTVCVLVTCSEFTNTKDPDDTMIFKDTSKEDAKKEELEKEKIEKERIEKEKIEKEKIEKERIEKEKLEKERIEKEKLEKEKERIDNERKKEKILEEEKERLEKLEKEKLEKEKLEKEKIEREKIEKEKIEKAKKEEEKKKKEEKKKEEDQKKKEEEQKKKEEEKKKKETGKKKYEATSGNSGEPANIFKLKKKVFAYETVPKEELPEGVASMTKSDTIVIEGGKRYKKIIYNKVMLDGTKKTEEVKQCLD